MEDKAIVDLFLRRDEQAVLETAAKYGAYCAAIAENVLDCPEDPEEILNDTWFAAWNDIPPSSPDCLRVYLGRITRNLALSRYRFFHRKKRYAGMDCLLSELEECIPAPENVERELARMELNRLLSDWLDALTPSDRRIFVRRYWYGVGVKRLAQENGLKHNAMEKRLQRLRRNLRTRLEREGVTR